MDDVLIGARGADPNGEGSGASYVVFGQATQPVPPVTCNGLPATIVGTFGNNTLFGTPRKDVIHGRGGNDLIFGLGGTTASAAARVTIGYSATKARTNCSAGLGTMS